MAFKQWLSCLLLALEVVLSGCLSSAMLGSVPIVVGLTADLIEVSPR